MKSKPPPLFLLEIKERFKDSEFVSKFERETNCPIINYRKNDHELAAAFILHREEIKFEYGRVYPENSHYRREVDFSLLEERLFKPLPDYLNVFNWPLTKPVRWIEIKKSLHHYLYDYVYNPVSQEKLKEIMNRVGDRRRNHQALVQREFLKRYGYETFPISEHGLSYYYYNGILADS